MAAWTPRLPADDVDVAHLHKILSDETISFSHRVDAAWKISFLDEEHWGDADRHLRLIIMARSIGLAYKLSAIDALARFGPRHRAEALGILTQIIADDGNTTLERLEATHRLRSYEDADQAYSVAFVRRVAEGKVGGDATHDDRIDALPRWLALAPEDRDLILALARELADHEETLNYQKEKMVEFINDVLTDPWT